jgi:MinD superfamily P-loop ATPase
MSPRVIRIEPLAPPKPTLGTACNGCGVCCLAEPCPLGILVSRRRRGRCVALRWHEAEAQYRCGLLMAPVGMPKLGSGRLSRWLARRWIAVGTGCDSTAEAEPVLVDR